VAVCPHDHPCTGQLLLDVLCYYGGITSNTTAVGGLPTLPPFNVDTHVVSTAAGCALPKASVDFRGACTFLCIQDPIDPHDNLARGLQVRVE
jgi:hypothetical protein